MAAMILRIMAIGAIGFNLGACIFLVVFLFRYHKQEDEYL